MDLPEKVSLVVSHCGIFPVRGKSDKENFPLQQQKIFAFASELEKERFSRDEFA